jgi:hypothetical protein
MILYVALLNGISHNGDDNLAKHIGRKEIKDTGSP